MCIFIFIIQVHKNIVKPRIRHQDNIDKIFSNNVDNIFQIKNSGNFKPDFFLNMYLLANIFQKITPSMGCRRYHIQIDFLA